MELTVAEFKRMIRQLFPRGKIWRMDDGKAITKLADGFAAESQRANKYLMDVINEADPQTTTQMISEWETVLNCAITGTDQERRNNIVANLTAQGGASEQYFLDIAAKYGHLTAAFKFYTPFRVTYTINRPVADEEWAFVCCLDYSDGAVSTVVIGSDTIDTGLSEYEDVAMERKIQAIKPAHIAIFYEVEA